jgi:hypothetical protein
MSEEFVESIHSLQSRATLVLGKRYVACNIVEMTDAEIHVVAHDANPYEGDSRATLIHRHVNYPVRLALQELRPDGIFYRLQRLSIPIPPNASAGQTRGWVVTSARFCAVGLIAAIATRYLSTSAASESLRELRRQVLGLRPARSTQSPLQSPPVVHVQTPAAETGQSSPELPGANSPQATIPVSLVTSRPVSAPQATAEASHREIPRAKSLPALLSAGQVGGMRSLDSNLVSWLIGAGHSEHLSAIRISDAALQDLGNFKLELSHLSHPSAMQATDSLRRALLGANALPDQARKVPGMQDVFVVTADDAELYFLSVHGTTDLIRVLPLTFTPSSDP